MTVCAFDDILEKTCIWFRFVGGRPEAVSAVKGEKEACIYLD